MPAEATKDSNGRLTIQVLGSKVERSRTGHKMMQQAIDMMKQDSIGKISLMNHDENQILGKVTGIAQSANDEIHPTILVKKETGNPIIDAPIAQVESCIDEDIPLGASVGGIADNVKFVEEEGKLGVDVYTLETMEWSVTPINAVRASDGTLKPVDQVCKDGVCGQIVQQILNGPYLPEITKGGEITLNQNTENKQNKGVTQSTGVTLNQTAYDFALQCIADKNIDFETPWNRGSWGGYSDETPDLQELVNSCLGVDETSSDYWDKYHFRICMNGTLYKNAVLAAAANAPAGSAVYEAADEILQKIYSIENTLETPVGESGKNNKLNQNSEVDSMDEKTKKLFKQQNEKIDGILNYIDEDIKAKKLAQKQAEEKVMREAMKAEVKQEVIEEFKETVLPALAESTKTAFDQRIAELTGTRTHVQSSAQGGGNPPGTETQVQQGTQGQGNVNPVLQTLQINPAVDPARSSIALNQKDVVWGQTTQGHTPAEYLNVNQ